MIALIVILSIIAYIAIGCVCGILFVKYDLADPYDDNDSEFLIGTIFGWPVLGLLGLAYCAFEKFIDYLKKLHDKED